MRFQISKLSVKSARLAGCIRLGGSAGLAYKSFFVLSGFVITASAQGSSPVRFLIKRGIRILPTLWVCTLVAFSIRAIWGEPVGELLGHAFRSAILSPKGPYIDGVVWTLVVEAVFYMFIALVLLLIERRNISEVQNTFDRAALMLGGISSLFLLTHLVAVSVGWQQADLFDRFFWVVFLLRHGVYFALGMLLWAIVSDEKTPLRLTGIAAMTIMCIVELVLKTGASIYAVFPVLLWLACTGWMYFSIVQNKALFPNGGAKWISILGLLTYPLYLNHFTFGEYLVPMLWSRMASPVAVLIVALVMVFGIAYFIAAVLEPRIQKWARRNLLSPSPRTTELLQSSSAKKT